MPREVIGARPGSRGSMTKRKNRVNANIREIFESEGRNGDALRKAIRYMFEHDPITAVHVYAKVLNTTTIGSAQGVTNIFAAQIDAQVAVGRLEDLVASTESAGNASLVSNEPVLLADGRAGADRC